MQLTLLLFFLYALRILGCIAAVAAGVMYTLIVMEIIVEEIDSEGTDTGDQDYWFFLFACIYGGIFAVMFFLTEFRLRKFLEIFTSLQNWAVRGFFYIFIGLNILTLLEGTFQFRNEDRENIDDFIRATSYVVIVIGLFYIVGEALCIRRRAQKDADNTKDFPKYV